MGRIIAKRIRGMNWMAKVSLVLIFTLVFSTFMYQGWYKPKQAQAAVAYGAFSESHTGTTGSTNQASFSWTHAGGASPRGVLVYVFTISATDYVTSVTYGGTTMTRVSGGAAIDTATEPGRVDTFFLGTAVPTGSQSVVVNRINNATIMYATAMSVTAGNDTEVTGIVLLQENGTFTAQSVDDGSIGTNSVRFAAGYSGGANVLAGSSSTVPGSIDFGNYTATVAYETTAGQGARNVGFAYATSDDRAAVHLAIREIIPPTLTVAATGTQIAGIYRNTVNNYLGGAFTLITDKDSVNITSITLSELGTIAANTYLSNPKIYYETAATCSYDGNETLFGTVAAFNASQQAVITGTITVGTSQVCAYVVLDVASTAPYADTIEIEITNPSTQVLASPAVVTPATAVAIPGTTTVVKLPSTISDCAGCHGYGAITDGTPRNNPDGTFVGSHNAHVVKAAKVCSVCHVTPATETSTSFGHRDSNIQIKSGSTAIDGGYYDKNNNSGYDAPGDITFAQSNSPVMSTCRTVYCHSEGTGATSNSGDTRPYDAPVTTLNWGDAGTCGSCHGYLGPGPSYTNGTPKANSHTVHRTSCSTCHNTTTTDGSTITNPANHLNKLYNISVANGATIGTYTYDVNGGTCTDISCHRPAGGAAEASRAWGTTFSPATDYECVDCHAQQQAITVGPALGGTRSIITGASGEFGLAWGHKKSGRGAVTDADCIVCHLEGKYTGAVGTAVLRASYHGDGYIDLRDPDGTGEARITDISGTSFRFAKFSTSYAAGSRTSTGHLSNNIDNVLTQKFCLACHDSTGATNTMARSNNGGTGDATMPFGNINLGANYTTANGAADAGGLVNVKDEFATTNTSVHPVRGPRNKDFPTAARLVSPYNNIAAGRTDAGHGLVNSVVINCFDCHNASTPLTTRTIVAHGNAATIRGTIYVDTSPYETFCDQCHTGYKTAANDHTHGAGSAGTTGAGGQLTGLMTGMCARCHGSQATYPARPLAAQDLHGNSNLVGGGTWTGSAASGGKVYGFIRNTANFIAHKPYNSTQWGVTTPTCQGDATHCAGDSGIQTYTPGGSY